MSLQIYSIGCQKKWHNDDALAYRLSVEIMQWCIYRVQVEMKEWCVLGWDGLLTESAAV